MEVIGRLWDGFKFELVYDNSDFNKIDFLIKNGNCKFNKCIGIVEEYKRLFVYDIFKTKKYDINFIVIFDGKYYVGVDVNYYNFVTNKIDGQPVIISIDETELSNIKKVGDICSDGFKLKLKADFG